MSRHTAETIHKYLNTLRPRPVLAAVAAGIALSGCYYYVPPSTQLSCVPAGQSAPQYPAGSQYPTAPQSSTAPQYSAPPPAYSDQTQAQAAGGCPAGTVASYVQTPGYSAPYYGYPYYGYPYYGYPYYGYGGYGYGYGWPGYGYGYAPVSVGVGFGWGWGWGHGRWR
jgi:hypothetical protein